jgi:hypothetical protein
VKVSLPPLPPLPTGGGTAQAQGTNPLIAPGLTTTAPLISPPLSGSHTTAAATVIEPATGSKRGLPVLIAVVLVLGLAAAYGRVAVGYVPAVDDGSGRHHRA